MTPEKWEILKRCAACEPLESTPVALIVDSPWIPGYVGISTLDYFQFAEDWLSANFKIQERFSDVIFIPGFWAEFGMATEPSGFGCKINFYEDRTPEVHPAFKSVAEAAEVDVPNPKTDGLMPFVLNLYKRCEPKIKDSDYAIKIVAARGPLTVASHLVGVTQLLLDLKLNPKETHQLLKKTATLTKNWLIAQADALSEVEGILVLDDIVGFLSPKDYLEFAHPYLKEVFDTFDGCVKMFHNDNFNTASFKYLADLKIQIFNFSHLIEINKARELIGDGVCLMGNVPPLEVLARGTKNEVIESALNCLKLHGKKQGIILSAGGGTSPATPSENILALVEAARIYDSMI